MMTLVTVLSCNDYTLTKASIERLLTSTNESFDILLIDNSYNGDKKVALAYEELDQQFPRRIIYKSHDDKNLGIAVSLNEAFDYCLKHEYVYFAQFHIDTYVGPQWLEKFYQAFNEYNAQGLAPLEQNDHYFFPEVNKKWDRQFQDNKIFFENTDDYKNHVNTIFGDFDREANLIQERYKYTLIPDTYSFSSYIMHKDVIKTVGYFDEEFFVGGEDRDFFNRMKIKGIKMYKFGGVFALHWGSMTYICSGAVRGKVAAERASKRHIEIEGKQERLFTNYCMRKSCTSNKLGACEIKLDPKLNCFGYILDENFTKKPENQELCKQ